jgi:uridine kinase
VRLADSDGSRMYRRSLVFLLTVAVEALHPGLKLAVEHSVPSGGFYCTVIGRPDFTAAELAAIAGQMRAMVTDDLPIVRQIMPLAEARAYFATHGDDDMVRLLESREKDYLTVYSLAGRLDYFFGYMVASTGCLAYFDLCPADGDEGGFILRFPRPETPGALQPYTPSAGLEAIFQQDKHWRRLMGLPDVGALNRATQEGRFCEEVLIAEALHTRYLDEIARQIAARHAQGTRLVLIAGPSSAGKTTFSKRLAVQLMAHGIQPFTLAMDDYFVDREQTPRDEHGEYDFEALAALNLARLNADLAALIDLAEVQLPRFDFLSGKSVPGSAARLTADHIIIAEGIHGLNPALLDGTVAARAARVYISAVTALNLNRHNRVPTTDVRLLRRLVRDARTRGYDAAQTLSRWASVRRGEKRNIFPHQEQADMVFNSSLAYELAVLRPVAEPLLRQVELESPHYIEARRLLAFLRWVRPAGTENVPNDSLLREFVGGSILDGYTPGSRARF